MTPKEIIAVAAKLLRMDDPTEKEQELLLRCFNLVYAEVACDFIPLVETETAIAEDGKVDYAALTKTLLNIVRVESGGIKQKSQMRPSHFTAPDGEVTVTYSYLPEEACMNDDIEYGAKVSPATFAYGVAAEYCLIEGDFDESQMWDKRYRDGLFSACRNRSEMRLPKRGWY